MDITRFCSTNDAARLAGVSRGMINQLIQQGKLRAFRVGRSWLVVRSDAEKYGKQPQTTGQPRRGTSS